MATPRHNSPWSRGSETYNFRSLFIGHHDNILSLSDLCLGLKKIFKEINHFHYTSYMATPCPGGNEIYNFGRPVLGHHYYILSLSELGLGVEKKIFF